MLCSQTPPPLSFLSHWCYDITMYAAIIIMETLVTGTVYVHVGFQIMIPEVTVLFLHPLIDWWTDEDKGSQYGRVENSHRLHLFLYLRCHQFDCFHHRFSEHPGVCI